LTGSLRKDIQESPEGSEGARQANIWRKHSLGRETASTKMTWRSPGKRERERERERNETSSQKYPTQKRAGRVLKW
jgi:hypothetical protein